MSKILKLSDVCLSIIDCPHESPVWLTKGYARIIRNFNLIDGQISDAEPYYVDENTYNKRTRRAIPEPGDIIFSREAPIGNCAIVPEEFKCCLGQRLVLLKVDHSKVSSEYLLTVLMSNYVKYQIEQVSKRGSIVSNFNIGDLSNLKIPVLTNQTDIAKLANDISSKITNNHSITNKLESIAKTIYDYWFLQFEFPNEEGKPYKSSGGKMVWNEELKREIPEGWKVKHLKDHQLIVGGTPSRREKKYWNGTIPWLTTSEINNGIIGKSKEFITDYGLTNSAAKLVNKDSLIVAMYGLGTAGRIGYLPYVSTTNQACCSISCKNEFELGYLYFFLKSQQRYIDTIVTGSIQKNLSKDTIGDFAYLYPNIELLEKADFKSFLDTMVNLTKENQELASLRDFLLPMLMNGQVTFKGDA